MTFKEFAEKNPKLIEEASKCSSKEEFAQFAKEQGVEIPKEELSQSYSYVKAYQGGELNEDVLEGVAGGKWQNVHQVQALGDGMYSVRVNAGDTTFQRMGADRVRKTESGDWQADV